MNAKEIFEIINDMIMKFQMWHGFTPDHIILHPVSWQILVSDIQLSHHTRIQSNDKRFQGIRVYLSLDATEHEVLVGTSQFN